MVMTTLSKVLAVPTVGSARRAETRALAIQVVPRTDRMRWVTKPIIIRNPPITSVLPTPRQAEWRYLFAENAKNWKGSRGYDHLKYDSVSKKHKAGDLVLAVQAKAQVVLKDVASTHRWKNEKKTEKVKYSVNEKEDLKRMAGL